MEKSLSFFRVFDVAFFAPGMVLVLAIWHARCLPKPIEKVDLTSSHGLVFGMAFLVCAFLLGILCHGVQRLAFWAFRKIRAGRRSPGVNPSFAVLSDDEQKATWYPVLKQETCDDLLMYFWYYRSTCWNLAVSLVVAAVLLWPTEKCSFDTLAAGAAIGALITLLLGCEFHAALQYAIRVLNSTPRADRTGST